MIYFYNVNSSSDSSMYSDIDLEKCDLEVISSFDLKDDSDSKSAASGSDQIDWSGSVVSCKDQIVLRLQVSAKKLVSKFVIFYVSFDSIIYLGDSH